MPSWPDSWEVPRVVRAHLLTGILLIHEHLEVGMKADPGIHEKAGLAAQEVQGPD